ncbi:receptor like protein 24 isoform X2 [Setaria viridis]|uniref:receptor like protein 24 isoform X2 n=1 Tax=Setaria viridis TaxID=4556 RepID=UPI001493A3B6|nr:receptor like protein 22-like isoform X2 [Setaria viridis]
MASIGWVLLLFLAQLHTLLSTSIAHRADGGNLTHLPVSFLCHPNQAKALLQLKKSFSFSRSTTRLSSWRNGTNCCLWEGVGCDPSSGHVTILDLNNRHLSSHGLDPALFSLLSLRRLDLSMNDIGGDTIRSTGFERFSGPMPAAIGELTNLRNLHIEDAGFSGPMPAAIGELTNLRNLHIEDAGFSGPMPAAIGELTNLRNLYIEDAGFSGPMPAAIGELTNLRNLYIKGAGFSGLMPAAIGELTNLRNMYIVQCGFSGPMPPAIGKLTNLRIMYIEDSGFSGSMPAPIGNLTNLEAMEIHGRQISGLIPNAIGQLNKLRWLVLQGCNFSGSIPSSIVNLTQLTMLDLSSNSLNGEIPPSIFSLPILNRLDLSFNQLSGPIQGFDKAGPQLETVTFKNNELSGFIPKAIFQLTSLVCIDVSSNNLIGSVDLAHFRRLTYLTVLNLSYNKLHVMASEDNNLVETSYLAGLQELGLASCKITRFPRFLRHVDRISYLDLSCNKISGDIPNWIWEMTWNVMESHLNLSHNMFTGMQLNSDVVPFNTPIDTLDLSFNRLSGMIPMPKLSGLILDYSNNMFSSLLPNWTSYLRDTIYLSMSKNNIHGHVSPSICNATDLNVFDLSYNYFNGPIPPCFIENIPRSVLNLRENRLKGMLPSNITTRCSLQTIDLHGNKIEGRLPRGLSNCTDLEVIDFGSNKIADAFPSWLRGLPKLSVLVLRSNQMYGTIGDIVGDTKCEECFPSLQIIDLASNNFSGTLRPQWFKQLKSMMAEFNSSGKTLETLNTINVNDVEHSYQYSVEIMYKGADMLFGRMLTTVTAIDFSKNSLEGTIPETFGSLVSLRVLSLSHNAFTGKIPAQLGSMTDLESLDLSCNQLSGDIPQELTDLTFLGSLNLSYNHLVGKIPQSRQFSTFDSSSFEGNAGLCGLQLPKFPCGSSPHSPGVAHGDKSSRHIDVVLFLFVGLGFGVGFAAAIVVKWDRFGRRFYCNCKSLAYLITTGR